MIETIMLYVLAGTALAGGVMMLLLRHPMRVAMALIVSMISLGGVYGLLGVHEIAVFQIMIYVSAVMVFMVFTIMLINVRDSAYTHRFSNLFLPAIAVAAGLAGLLIWCLLKSPVAPPTQGDADFGVVNFSITFMQKYWLHFELTSVLLLVAIVAAVTVVKGGGRSRG